MPDAIPGFVLRSSPPRSKKTSNRIIQIAIKGSKACRSCGHRKGFPRVMPSEAFEYWRRLAMEEALVIKGQLQRRGIELPIIDHVSVRALFYQDVDRADACGLYQGLGDFLQDAGILKNDRQIADWDGSRRLVDRADPRIEIFIQVVKRVPAEQDLLAGIGAQEG